MRCNGHQVDRVVVREASSQVELESTGSGVYPRLPLLNHSCDHNTLRIFRNNQVVLLAARSELSLSSAMSSPHVSAGRLRRGRR